MLHSFNMAVNKKEFFLPCELVRASPGFGLDIGELNYCIKKDEQIYFYLKKYFELRFHLWTLPRENNM